MQEIQDLENLSLLKEKERITSILQDLKILTRDLEDFGEQRRYKRLIKKFEGKLREIEDTNAEYKS